MTWLQSRAKRRRKATGDETRTGTPAARLVLRRAACRRGLRSPARDNLRVSPDSRRRLSVGCCTESAGRVRASCGVCSHAASRGFAHEHRSPGGCHFRRVLAVEPDHGLTSTRSPLLTRRTHRLAPAAAPGMGVQSPLPAHRLSIALRKFWCPRSESNRHAFKGGGFSCHFGFRRPERNTDSGSWSGARLHRSLVGRRCPPSALYTFLRTCEGLARHQLELRTAKGLHRV